MKKGLAGLALPGLLGAMMLGAQERQFDTFRGQVRLSASPSMPLNKKQAKARKRAKAASKARKRTYQSK